MTELSAAQLLLIARQQDGAGLSGAAEDLCRMILAGDRRHIGATRLLAEIAERTGRLDTAVAMLSQAMEFAPQDGALHGQLGGTLRRLGRGDEAIVAYRRATTLDGEDAGGWRALAETLFDAGAYDESATAYRRAIALGVDEPMSHTRFGLALLEIGGVDEAIDAADKALAQDGQLAEAHALRGGVLQKRGELEPALAAWQNAIANDPDNATYHVRLGDVLAEMGRKDQSVRAYRQALMLQPQDPTLTSQMDAELRSQAVFELAIEAQRQEVAMNPEDPEPHFVLGTMFQKRRHFDQAMACYDNALALEADHLAAMNNMALMLEHKGRLDEGIAMYRRLIERHPHAASCHSNLVYSLHFHPDYDASALAREHARWRGRHADPWRAEIQPHRNDRSPDRRLRIGYVSPNLRTHPVGRFVNGFMAHHDHQRYEIICYASVKQADALTEKIRSACDRWVPVASWSDAALARQIREDSVDVLIDLAMHMSDNRMLTFARKPAPVQISYLAYCSTTGLDTIDYRLTDSYLEADSDGYGYVERPLVLPQTYWSYQPGVATPPVGPLPAAAKGYVTFASLNNFCKVTPTVLALWARLLAQVPHSRMLIHCIQGDHRQQVQHFFAERGVEAHRLAFFDLVPLTAFFQLLNRIDIALDPFPYPGGTTTCDALWMGVPVISLPGQLPHTRSGLSILSNVGLEKLTVRSERAYLQTALALAGDLSRLDRLRQTLRQRMQQSPLMDGSQFARDLESRYRQAWRQWCASR